MSICYSTSETSLGRHGLTHNMEKLDGDIGLIQKRLQRYPLTPKAQSHIDLLVAWCMNNHNITHLISNYLSVGDYVPGRRIE